MEKMPPANEKTLQSTMKEEGASNEKLWYHQRKTTPTAMKNKVISGGFAKGSVGAPKAEMGQCHGGQIVWTQIIGGV